jgi:phosphoglycerate dehydrogenase-like enzyme
LNILISDPIDEHAVKELRKFCNLLRKGEEAKADIVIVRSRTVIDRAYVNKAKNLKMIIRAGVGLDNIRDVEYC